jgi:RNase P subunit RPR2
MCGICQLESDLARSREEAKMWEAAAREYVAARQKAEEERDAALKTIEKLNLCPNCRSSLVHVNPGTGEIDTYCEDCGWPDEERVDE